MVTLVSCVSDKPVDNEKSSIEDIYFSDYESPKEKWGFLDTTDNIIIKPIYDDVRDMIRPIIAANYKGKWGFIDHKGKEKIKFKYKQVHDFDNEMTSCIVQTFDNEWLLIDPSDKIIDSLAYVNYTANQSGYYPVSSGSSWGLIDLRGKVIIEPSYQSIKVIDDDICIAKKYDKYGVISLDQKILMPYEYNRIDPTGEGMLRVKKNGKYAFYSNYQKLSKDYDYASHMEDGYFYTKNNDNSYTILDRKFQKQSTIKADKIEYGGEGKWKYKENGRWGIMEVDGTQVTPPLYDLMNRYQEGYIIMSIDDGWGYLDKNGEVFIPPELPLAWEFKNGYARIFHRNGVGFINKEKILVVDSRMFEVRDFYNGLARFQTM